MALSSCIKCGNHIFEVVEANPKKSNEVVWFYQCANCGGVVGVLDYDNPSYLLRKLAKALKIDLDAKP